MPHYSIHHTCPLTTPQCHALATAITDLHCSTFSAPPAFVNVTFHRTFREDTVPSNSLSGDVTHFIAVGGKRVWTNYIHAHLRARPDGDRKIFNDLAAGIMNLWNTHARPEDTSSSSSTLSTNSNSNNKTSKEPHGRLDDPRALHNVSIMDDITAGYKQGLLVPVAGDDERWMEEQMGVFEERARSGDQSMKTLVEDAKMILAKRREVSKL